MTETDHYNPDDLPWGAARIPDWWFEVTPHHVLDFDEMEMEHRRERARLASLSERLGSPVGGESDDGSLLAETATGPYSLPGFQPANGIQDASFGCMTGQQPRWYITSNGFFYVLDEPDVLHTASQMVESGYLPPGMDDCFGPGWDRAKALSSPVDNRMYARQEQAAWEKPDWLKQKLRSTDQGTAIRYGLPDLEVGKVIQHKGRLTPGDDEDVMSAMSGALSQTNSHQQQPQQPHHQQQQQQQQQAPLSPAVLQSSAQPSNAWKKKLGEEAADVPDWQKKRSEILKAKAAEEVVIEASRDPANVTPLSPPKAPDTKPVVTSAPLSPAKPGTLGAVSPPWQKNPEESASSPVPAWKKKTLPGPSNTTGSATTDSSASSSWKKKQEEPASSVPAWKKKTTTPEEEEVSSAKLQPWQQKAKQQPQESASAVVPAWKKSPVVKNDTVPRPAPVVPSWNNKPEKETTMSTSSSKATSEEAKKNNVTSPSAAKSASRVPAPPKPVAAPAPEPPKQASEPAPAPPKQASAPAPAPPKQASVTAHAPPKQASATAPAPPKQASAPAPKPIQEKAKEEPKSEPDLKADALVSQGLVLKLIALPDDSARAKELRNTVAPTPENNGIVLVKPSDLLIAIAYHAQNFKGHPESKEKIDSLRQVAIIARLVIMKLYGSTSPELKQFEDGLRPAFS